MLMPAAASALQSFRQSRYLLTSSPTCSSRIRMGLSVPARHGYSLSAPVNIFSLEVSLGEQYPLSISHVVRSIRKSEVTGQLR
jgi:hypothetical protein